MLSKTNYFNRFKVSGFFTVLLASLLITLLAGCGNTTVPPEDSTDSTLSRLPLNDTGAVLFTQTFAPATSDPTMENLLSSTPDATATGQDAEMGRDVSENNSLDGLYGFQFIKLDETGQPLSDQSAIYTETPWHCVKDIVTGLIWEVKTSSGLRMNRYTYTWYESNSSLNGGHEGALGPTVICGSFLVSCDTQSYKTAVNALNDGKGLCGLTNWRLPLREELRSIAHYGSTTETTIDANYFPNTVNSDTWTAQTAYYSSYDGTYAWEFHFDTGHSEAHPKSSESVNVRLVHNP